MAPHGVCLAHPCLLKVVSCLIATIVFCQTILRADRPSSNAVAAALKNVSDQDWGYVDVREGAHMFWWLFETTHNDGAGNRPLVMWIQGGPGYAGSGRGNFKLIGPLDLDMNPRNTTWVQEVSLLFVDNPVGTGYSYVDSDSAFTTDIDAIASDLLTFTEVFLNEHPKFKDVPFYIIGQSYGGKMAAAFAQKLYQNVQNGSISCNIQGVAMGNSWISPVDSTTSWAPFLLQMGIVDQLDHDAIDEVALKVKRAIENGSWESATDLWVETQDMVWERTPQVDFYNILNYHKSSISGRETRDVGRRRFPTAYPASSPDDYNTVKLMNGDVRDYLGIIPKKVKWKVHNYDVVEHQYNDFMKPVYEIVSDLLENSNLHVVVYQGQMDLICCTMGALTWVERMSWSGLENYNQAKRRTLTDPTTGQPEMFIKSYDTFDFYWLLEAGHSVAREQPGATLRLLQNIIATDKKRL